MIIKSKLRKRIEQQHIKCQHNIAFYTGAKLEANNPYTRAVFDGLILEQKRISKILISLL